jgi:hypothetical protein
MNASKCILVFGMTAIFSMAFGAANAESVPIVNSDFESPVITNPPYIYGQIYEDLSPLLPWVVWHGALTNPTMLDAALPGSGYDIGMAGHGAQVAYMSCDTPATNRAYWYQELNANFEAGKDYTLSMSGAMAVGPANVGQTLEMRLGYWGETPNAMNGPEIVSQKLIGNTEITDSWSDYMISSGAVSGDAVGKPIIVYISQGQVDPVSGPQYYFDNVQVSAVPEPCTFVLLTSGLLGLMAFAWRKRK